MATLRTWAMSLDNPLSFVEFKCTEPLTAEELKDVLEWMEIVKRQITRFSPEVNHG